VVISPFGVRCVWQRHDLENTKKRLKALAAKVAQDGVILTAAQVAAMEKARAEKEADGEFDSECPGYCVAQDTFPGHLPCRHAERRRPGLSADRDRHLCEGRLRQALHQQDADHGC